MNINDLQIEGIIQCLPQDFTAKRGRLDKQEIIIGKSSETLGAITVKLCSEKDGSATWYVATFRDVSPRQVSEDNEIALAETVQSAYYWGEMIKLVKFGTQVVS